ncbi:peptide chain release factor 3 [Salmonella sp. NCTC 11881]|nr:peptide chain release factor 3 [Salmonella sp. NCTC 11881]
MNPSTWRRRAGWKAPMRRNSKSLSVRMKRSWRWMAATTLTYIAPTMVNLNLTQERYPDVQFRKNARTLIPFRARHPPRLRTFPAFLTAYGMFLNPAFFSPICLFFIRTDKRF